MCTHKACKIASLTKVAAALFDDPADAAVALSTVAIGLAAGAGLSPEELKTRTVRYSLDAVSELEQVEADHEQDRAVVATGPITIPNGAPIH